MFSEAIELVLDFLLLLDTTIVTILTLLNYLLMFCNNWIPKNYILLRLKDIILWLIKLILLKPILNKILKEEPYLMYRSLPKNFSLSLERLMMDFWLEMTDLLLNRLLLILKMEIMTLLLLEVWPLETLIYLKELKMDGKLILKMTTVPTLLQDLRDILIILNILNNDLILILDYFYFL